jgi:hypothetical protein
MKANEILKWFGFKQGRATKRNIRGLWAAWPDETESIFVGPGSRFENLGLQVGQNYRIERAFEAIGCEVE